eukprot:2643212-Alexandrium_andersonii.AAC.1
MLYQVFARARQRELSHNREVLYTPTEYDWRATQALERNLQPPEITLCRRIQAMGVWTQAVLHHAGSREDDVCPHCQGARETWIHKWWECP